MSITGYRIKAIAIRVTITIVSRLTRRPTGAMLPQIGQVISSVPTFLPPHFAHTCRAMDYEPFRDARGLDVFDVDAFGLDGLRACDFGAYDFGFAGDGTDFFGDADRDLDVLGGALGSHLDTPPWCEQVPLLWAE